MEPEVDRYGIPITTTATSTTTTGFLGRNQRKTFAGLLCLEWVFLVTSFINIVATIVMTSIRLYEIVNKTEDTKLVENTNFVFCILLLVNGCFCAFYVIHGLFLERNFEIYAFMAATSFVLLYCILEYAVNVEGRTDLKFGRLIAICVLAPINIIIAGLVARQFGWLEFRIVGASEALQHMYTEVCRFMSFLRFDFQISVSMVILVLESFELYEQIILGVGLPITFFWMVFGMVLVRKEWKKAVWLFVLFGLLAPAYVIFKIYDVYATLHGENLKKGERYIEYAILIAASAALLIRAIIFFELHAVVRNFGKGLRERAFDKQLGDEVSERTSLLRSENAGRGQGNVRIVA